MLESTKSNLQPVAEYVEHRGFLAQEIDNATRRSQVRVPIGSCENLAPVKNDSLKLVVLPAAMTEPEARQCLSEIKGHWTSIRALVLELKERRGWEALKYPNLTACLEAEFSESRTKLVRELKAAEIEKYILQVPIGTWPASHFRPLSQLKPEQYKLALDKADELAGVDKLTAVHIATAVKQIAESTRLRQQVEPSKFQPQELVWIKCQARGLPEQKIWNGCWGIVQSTGLHVRVVVAGKEVDYAASDLQKDKLCDVQFGLTCKRISALWQTELEAIEQTVLKELQRRDFFTELEIQMIDCMEAKNYYHKSCLLPARCC